jgi:alkanesulfonate monooxygenase SsuD/methylene tetrahydromethanopterin reductase-like flavin-dependent oxidoreductase (luciferase family)
MHFGLALGPHNLPHDRNHWDTTRDMARAAEELGFDSVWMNDHVMFRSEEQPEAIFPWLKCFLDLGGLAASTKRER